MNPYKKCLSYGVDQTNFSSCKHLSKCREVQIFKFKQGKLSGDYNNDEKNIATKGTKMYKICSVIKHGRGMKDNSPVFFDGAIRNRGYRSITNKGYKGAKIKKL